LTLIALTLMRTAEANTEPQPSHLVKDRDTIIAAAEPGTNVNYSG
jgi:hypothetical protein